MVVFSGKMTKTQYAFLCKGVGGMLLQRHLFPAIFSILLLPLLLFVHLWYKVEKVTQHTWEIMQFFFSVDKFPEAVSSSYTAAGPGHHWNGSRQVGREKVGSASAVCFISITRRKITICLADFRAQHCQRCSILLLVSSPKAANRWGELMEEVWCRIASASL